MVINKVEEPEQDNSQPDDSVKTEDDNTVIADDENQVVDDDPASQDQTPPELPHEWMNGLTAEQKADKEFIATLEKFKKGIPDIAKAYVELSRKTGKPVVPEEGASEEEVNAFYESLGVPKSPEDYELSKVELPKDSLFKADKEAEKEFLKWFHELKLTPEQVNGLRERYYPYMAQSLADAQKIVKTSEEDAIKEFTKDMKPDEAKRAQNLMARAFQKYGSDEVAAMMELTGIGNFPPFLKMFSDIGAAIGESLFVDAEAAPSPGGAPYGRRSNAELATAIYGEKK